MDAAEITVYLPGIGKPVPAGHVGTLTRVEDNAAGHVGVKLVLNRRMMNKLFRRGGKRLVDKFDSEAQTS